MRPSRRVMEKESGMQLESRVGKKISNRRGEKRNTPAQKRGFGEKHRGTKKSAYVQRGKNSAKHQGGSRMA